MSNPLATLTDIWTWQLVEHRDTIYTAGIYSNRHSAHPPNFEREIDLYGVSPDELRRFAEALLTVADRIEADDHSDEED